LVILVALLASHLNGRLEKWRIKRLQASDLRRKTVIGTDSTVDTSQNFRQKLYAIVRNLIKSIGVVLFFLWTSQLIRAVSQFIITTSAALHASPKELWLAGGWSLKYLVVAFYAGAGMFATVFDNDDDLEERPLVEPGMNLFNFADSNGWPTMEEILSKVSHGQELDELAKSLREIRELALSRPLSRKQDLRNQILASKYAKNVNDLMDKISLALQLTLKTVKTIPEPPQQRRREDPPLEPVHKRKWKTSLPHGIESRIQTWAAIKLNNRYVFSKTAGIKPEEFIYTIETQAFKGVEIHVALQWSLTPTPAGDRIRVSKIEGIESPAHRKERDRMGVALLIEAFLDYVHTLHEAGNLSRAEIIQFDVPSKPKQIWATAWGNTGFIENLTPKGAMPSPRSILEGGPLFWAWTDAALQLLHENARPEAPTKRYSHKKIGRVITGVLLLLVPFTPTRTEANPASSNSLTVINRRKPSRRSVDSAA
jgi:hypothetical protein